MGRSCSSESDEEDMNARGRTNSKYGMVSIKAVRKEQRGRQPREAWREHAPLASM